MAHFEAFEPAAASAFKSWMNHCWYLDPQTVILALANSDLSVPEEMKQEMAKKLYSTPRPTDYDFDRKNNSGFVDGKDHFLKSSSPPSLTEYVSAESWLVFDILEHGPAQVKWLFYPASSWHMDPDYIEFQKFVKDIAVVNDAGERAVKAVQETVHQACSEKKLQRMLLVKSKISKPSSRTKAAYRAAAEQLTPTEQLSIAFSIQQRETEVSSSSEIESSMDDVDEYNILAALEKENNSLNEAESRNNI